MLVSPGIHERPQRHRRIRRQEKSMAVMPYAWHAPMLSNRGMKSENALLESASFDVTG
jgi:hypothetical protein